jgi:hypothetical protein
MDNGGSLMLREVVEQHHARYSAALLDELTARVDSALAEARLQAARESAEQERLKSATEIQIARESAARDTRLAVVESFNQTLRRIRQATTEDAVLDIVLENTAGEAVVLEVENGQARSRPMRGGAGGFTFGLETAPAVAGVCESQEPQVALASESELSPELAAALGSDDASVKADASVRKAYLFPVVARHEVVAVVVVSGEPTPASLVPSAMEMLSEAAGLKIEALKAESSAAAAMDTVLKPLPSPELVQIAPPSVPETTGVAAPAWADLSPEDQKLHLQAQRVARVKVAEIRLYHPDELRKGVFESNIYGALGSLIDQARADFLQTFLSKSPTMVDYLHLEILRSLAHEDDRLLGEEYPGPMV